MSKDRRAVAEENVRHFYQTRGMFVDAKIFEASVELYLEGFRTGQIIPHENSNLENAESLPINFGINPGKRV